MTEDEAKAERKRQQEGMDALASPKNNAVMCAVLDALAELRDVRVNLTATQQRCTQLLDESRGMRRVLLKCVDDLSKGLRSLDAIVYDMRKAAEVPPCT